MPDYDDAWHEDWYRVRNTNTGRATSESRFLHRGRSLIVVESRVTGEDGRLLCTVTSSTHVPSPRPPAQG